MLVKCLHTYFSSFVNNSMLKAGFPLAGEILGYFPKYQVHDFLWKSDLVFTLCMRGTKIYSFLVNDLEEKFGKHL